MASSTPCRLKHECSYEATSLEALPTDILNQILYQLDAQQQARLRLTCRLLAGAVSSQLSHASTALHISRAAALSLQQAFPRLVSLALIDPLSTHRLPLLTRLISVSLALSKRSLSSSMTVDLAPLEDLPSLHTLHLENVQMQRLAPGPACIMAALTQLKALRLVDCTVAGPGSAKPQDLAALPGVTKLQVVDQSPAGLVRLTGLHNMQQVEVLELQNAVSCNSASFLTRALATCARLHTLIATGLWPLDLEALRQAPCLECLAVNLCQGSSLLPLADLPRLRYLDLGNSSFGESALPELAQTLPTMPGLQLCVVTLLRQPGQPAPELELKQTRLRRTMTRQIALSGRIAHGHRKLAGTAAEEWWLCSSSTGALLRRHELAGQDVWDWLRQLAPQASDCRLLAFLKLVSQGLGYRNVSACLEDAKLQGVWQRQHALPGQQLNCCLDSPVDMDSSMNEWDE